MENVIEKITFYNKLITILMRQLAREVAKLEPCPDTEVGSTAESERGL